MVENIDSMWEIIDHHKNEEREDANAKTKTKRRNETEQLTKRVGKPPEVLLYVTCHGILQGRFLSHGS